MNSERKGQSGKGKGAGALRAAAYFSLFSFLFYLTSCGFHLRGASSVALPPELSTLRVTMGGKGYPPLLVEMRNALLALGDVRLTDDVSASVPVLQLHSESSESRVLAIDSSGRISAYLLNYRVDYSLVGADNKPLLPKQIFWARWLNRAGATYDHGLISLADIDDSNTFSFPSYPGYTQNVHSAMIFPVVCKSGRPRRVRLQVWRNLDGGGVWLGRPIVLPGACSWILPSTSLTNRTIDL